MKPTQQSFGPPIIVEGTPERVAPPSLASTSGLTGVASLEDPVEKKLDEIEMIGEEQAAGLTSPRSEITPGMRYLHCSRTIHQLVTDRNRAVGLYLAVASLLWTASTALLNVKPTPDYPYQHLMVPLERLQRWCVPATFGTLTVLALFVGFLLIRTRIGLIYEVAKMNVLLGLPVGRVKRVNPLSIFFIMHALISLAGGCSGGVLTAMVLYRDGFARQQVSLFAYLVGIGITAFLVFLYIVTVRHTTADSKLQNLQG